MTSKTVYRIDNSGLYVGAVMADESPLEPGVWLLPAKTVEPVPPVEWPSDKWPRWSGSAWVLVNKPQPVDGNAAAEKLAAFLQQNPDVAALINSQAPA